MWWVLSSYPTVVGGVAAVFLAFVVIAFTHFIFKSEESSSETENVNITHGPERRESLKEHLKKHYTKEHLAEIARCAVMLDKLGSGDGEAISQKLDSNKSCVDGDTKPENNLPAEEPDIYELLDISIDDEDDDQVNEDVISPQARADIEAELLDSSMLSAVDSEEMDEPDIVPDENTKIAQEVELSVEQNVTSQETKIELDESESEETEVLYEDDIINSQDEIRLSDVCNMRQPENVKCYQEVANSLTHNEIQEEERAQETQLNQILELMQQHPELFGDMSKSEMTEQAALYCV
uniref:FK506-binding protein 3 n=1 Tax=Phallusia mammillata TaxID=59560 RepID=A0A6F9DCV8_9ASCI|nr:FK506-binding protein 3 [Phallusia mammillata]